jgi:hypothetical protein
MANCSIPSSTPATGRTSTTSSRRSKSSSNRQFFCRGSCQLPVMGRRRSSLQLGSTFFLNSAIRKEFTRRGGQSAIGRVKGAWWPSRSSKPSSPRKWRGRFDSYPLRLFRFDGRGLRFDLPFGAAISHQTSSIKHQTFRKGGDLDVA